MFQRRVNDTPELMTLLVKRLGHVNVHPYYVSTQAHPEFKSRPTKAHPLFAGLIAAAVAQQDS